jgi:hypothetical protein
MHETPPLRLTDLEKRKFMSLSLRDCEVFSANVRFLLPKAHEAIESLLKQCPPGTRLDITRDVIIPPSNVTPPVARLLVDFIYRSLHEKSVVHNAVLKADKSGKTH